MARIRGSPMRSGNVARDFLHYGEAVYRLPRLFARHNADEGMLVHPTDGKAGLYISGLNDHPQPVAIPGWGIRVKVAAAKRLIHAPQNVSRGASLGIELTAIDPMKALGCLVPAGCNMPFQSRPDEVGFNLNVASFGISESPADLDRRAVKARGFDIVEDGKERQSGGSLFYAAPV